MDASSQWLTPRPKSNDDHSSTLKLYARSMDATTARSSFDYYSSPRLHNRLKQGAPPSRSLTALSTPHDQILEKMYKHPGKSESALPLPSNPNDNVMSPNHHSTRSGDAYHTGFVGLNTYQNTNPGSRSLNEPANVHEGAVGATPTTSFASNPFPTTKLYDPFDGSPLGIITSEEETSGRGGENMPTNTEANTNEELWSHLSRVLDLQNQIARMHVDMEGVGLGKPLDGKGKGVIGNAPRTGGFIRPRTTSTSSVPGGDIGDEEGIGAIDEETEKLKAREREFKKLATQFEGRKEAINEMMGKLDDLSRALTEFHSLEAHKVEFSNSRNNTLNTATHEKLSLPVVVPLSHTASPVEPGESSLRSSKMPIRLPTTSYLEPTSHDRHTNQSHLSGGSTQHLTKSLGRRDQVPTLIINPTETGSQNVVDSPTSTASLNLVHEK